MSLNPSTVKETYEQYKKRLRSLPNCIQPHFQKGESCVNCQGCAFKDDPYECPIPRLFIGFPELKDLLPKLLEEKQ